jgi:hypothetical protein
LEKGFFNGYFTDLQWSIQQSLTQVYLYSIAIGLGAFAEWFAYLVKKLYRVNQFKS